MPYITKDRREKLLIKVPTWGEVIDFQSIESAGDLNYVFTCLAKSYITSKGENYQNYNDVMGALEGAKLELYRRRTAPYEDTKIKENGDV